ncbi:hypothetical protein [Cyclobacterium roseum]|uniref:hypothetical protein n=1 Tax=Cyclobacterium roseum TaxID=2666137 RepID=UPI0013906FD6|nr:hypothetical protein [Cyclobacterium roseum]
MSDLEEAQIALVISKLPSLKSNNNLTGLRILRIMKNVLRIVKLFFQGVKKIPK